MKPRLFLAEDDLSIRQMLAFFLTSCCKYQVLGECHEGKQAIEQCETLKPMIVIADLRLPGLNGVGLLRELRQRHLPTAVIFYTGATHEVCMSEAVLAEPEGFVLKSDEISHLRQAITSICTGKRYWSPAVGELRAKIASTAERLARLTESEVQVLALLTAGRSTKEIASALYKSEHTISHQRQSLMDKLNLHNAVALANFARAAGVGE